MILNTSFSTVFDINLGTYKELSTLVASRFFDRNNIENELRVGPLETNYWSFSFNIDIVEKSGNKGVYVKIPNVNRIQKVMKPLSKADRLLAKKEYESLVFLNQSWCSNDIGVSFIKPLDFLEEYNAIVTERAYGNFFFEKFRRFALLRKLKRNISHDTVNDSMFRLGKALSRFHNLYCTKVDFKGTKVVSKIIGYCSKLNLFGVNQRKLEYILRSIKHVHDYKVSVHSTITLKGLDVRNILVDDTGRLFLFDPGAMKPDYNEADLARFIATCRILYWGSMTLFLRLCPHRSYEESFLKGYFGCGNKPGKILIVLIIKELFKHWVMAYEELQLKKWPIVLKQFLKSVYIDPFYESQIRKEVANLEQ